MRAIPSDSQAPGPGEDQRPAWRAALSAYRRALFEGGYEWECFHLGVEAYLTEAPHIDVATARAEVVRAIHWASINHNAWLYPRNDDGTSAGRPSPHQLHWLRLRGLA
jgi:hypothetical protein